MLLNFEWSKLEKIIFLFTFLQARYPTVILTLCHVCLSHSHLYILIKACGPLQCLSDIKRQVPWLLSAAP